MNQISNGYQTNFQGVSWTRPPHGGNPALQAQPWNAQQVQFQLGQLMNAFSALFAGFGSFLGGSPTPNPGAFGGYPQNGSGGGYINQGPPLNQFNPGQFGGHHIPANQRTPEQQREYDSAAAGQLFQGFDEFDTNKDGILTANELNLMAEKHKDQYPGMAESWKGFADAGPELMFLSIQSGDSAWMGMSKKDVKLLMQRLNNGETLPNIQEEIRNRVISERNISFTPATTTKLEAFRGYVERQRERVLR
mgnify:CR=1 FL=1